MVSSRFRSRSDYEAPGPVVRHHQPAAYRRDGPPAGRGRGDRRTARRRAGLRQLERNPRGRLGEDRGGPAGPARRDGGAPGDGGARYVEDAVGKAGGAVLRYGAFYGPGATDDQVELGASGSSRSSGEAPATARGCISTTRRARASWRWSRWRTACSTLSVKNRHRPRVAGDLAGCACAAHTWRTDRGESPQPRGFPGPAWRGPSSKEPSISATRVFTIDSPRLRDLRQSKPTGSPRPSSLISTRRRPPSRPGTTPNLARVVR